MADNIAVTPGSGATIASDDISSVHWVYSKLAWGADGTATPIAATTGAALPIRGVSGAQAVVVDGSGVTQPVSGTVAFSNTTIAVTNAGTFATQAVCTNAGTFAVQAAQSGTWTVGLSAAQTLDTVTNVGTLGTITNVVHVDDNGSTLTVDGTVAFSNTTIAVTNAGTFATQAVCTNAGTFAVQVSSALPAGSNAIGKLAANDGVDIGDVTINNATIAVTKSGTWDITNAGTFAVQATCTNAGTFAVQAACTNAGTFATQPGPSTSGGCTVTRTLSSASSGTATNIKASAGHLYGLQVSNVNASPRFLKLYNSGSAPTMGSGTPVMTIVIPGNAAGASGNFEFPMGIAFSSGIGFTICGAVADNDTTQISANEVIVNVIWK